ncbi:P-loop containing nucleoside triphosphate hydrolase protein [Aspergillus pseudonomiae]|nr:P-loop containing nucleoside triphosphate hydrolase protein [Aspergillus pseudonomiae]
MGQSRTHHHEHMKVLGLGLCRTGTDSLREALRILGYANPYHGFSCLENPADCALWCLALSAKYNGVGKPFGREEFVKILCNSQAVSGDFPVPCFGPELIEAYPEAKVILTYRDVDEWHQSVSKTLDYTVRSGLSGAGTILARTLGLQRSWILPTWLKIWEGFFRGDFQNNGCSAFHEHCELIQRLVPSRRLLIFHVRQGWGPLCEFLDVPVPFVPFPRGNDPQSYHRRFAYLVIFNNRTRVYMMNSLRVGTTIFSVIPGTLWI